MIRQSVANLVFYSLMIAAMFLPSVAMADEKKPSFVRTNVQYIAAVAEPGAKSGTGAQDWLIWRQDPGPRGVPLRDFDELVANDGVAPAGWSYNPTDWWLDEYGQLMEHPTSALPPGQYIVTGARETAAILTVSEPDDAGNMGWKLSDDATIHDVTHLKCRAARYSPISEDSGCSPERAPQNVFTLKPGDVMPQVKGCSKRDYPVLIVVAIGVDDGSPLLNQ